MRPAPQAGRAALAVNLELSHGVHGASARLEWHDRKGTRVALLKLSGWLDRAAAGRLEQALDHLAERGGGPLLVDCSRLRHIDYRMVPLLVDALSRYESRAGNYAVCGLSNYLRDLFRIGGREPRVSWPGAPDLLLAAGDPGDESAS